jgi:dienelactone hydrolase
MSISAACSVCGKIYKLEERFIGKRAKCKTCGEEFVVRAGAVSGATVTGPILSAANAVKAAPPPEGDGEFDFSNLDDIEKSGTMDESYRPPEIAPAPTGERPRGTAAPAHLRQSVNAAPPVEKSMKPTVIAFVAGGIAITVVTFFIMHKMVGSSSDSPPLIANIKAAAKENISDGTGLTAQKFVANAEARKQADRDAIAPVQIPPLTYPVRTTFPELGDLQNDGFHDRYLVQLSGEYLGEPMGMVLYVPSGTHGAHSLACIMLAPAMDNALEGNTSTEHDIKDAAAFVELGFAVMLYDTSRYSILDRPRTPGFCVVEYAQSDGGTHFARNAMNLMASKATMIDMKRVYAVGWGSSATVALNLAAMDHRIRAVAAVSPVCDIAGHLGTPAAELEHTNRVSGIGDMMKKLSPINNVAKIQCPVLFLNSSDSSARPSKGDGIDAFAKAMEAGGKVAVIDSIKTEPEKNFLREVAAPYIAKWLKAH